MLPQLERRMGVSSLIAWKLTCIQGYMVERYCIAGGETSRDECVKPYWVRSYHVHKAIW